MSSRLSIVIAAWNDAASLERCLRSLPGDDGDEGDDEVIVSTNLVIPEGLRAQFPRVRFLVHAAATTVPELRSAAVFEAAGDIVAITEDHCRFGTGWRQHVKEAHQGSESAIGGPVENARVEHPLDWAVYFYDYGKYMLPLQRGPASQLSGANASYKRAALMAESESFRDGFFEPVVHGALSQKHGRLSLNPNPVVYHDKSYRLAEAVGQAYHLARSYAALRTQYGARWRCHVLAAGAPLLFFILPARVVMQVLAKRRKRKELLRCLPYLLVLTASWAWGELRGYLGGAGSSRSRWR